jgi:acyl carrier protein
MPSQSAAVTTVSHQLAELTEADRSGVIRKIVREVTCRVCQLEIPPEELNDRDRLGDLGMDSLIALELRGELGKALGLEGKISATVAFDTGTIGELAQLLISIVENQNDSQSGKQPASDATRQPLEINVEDLEAMTDAEVEKLLQDRLRA